MTIHYRMVELKEGEPVQYVGVYLLKWKQEWGQPDVGFIEENDQDEIPNFLISFKESLDKEHDLELLKEMRKEMIEDDNDREEEIHNARYGN